MLKITKKNEHTRIVELKDSELFVEIESHPHGTQLYYIFRVYKKRSVLGLFKKMVWKETRYTLQVDDFGYTAIEVVENYQSEMLQQMIRQRQSTE